MTPTTLTFCYYVACCVAVAALLVGFIHAHHAWKRHVLKRHADFLRRYGRQAGRR